MASEIGNRAALPGLGVHDDCRCGLWRRDHFPEDNVSKRLASFLGPGASAKVLIVLLTSAVFALGHYANLRVPGVAQAMITGLVFGAIFAVTGRTGCDVRACCVRSNGGRDNLLESRSRCRSPRVQNSRGVA